MKKSYWGSWLKRMSKRIKIIRICSIIGVIAIVIFVCLYKFNLHKDIPTIVWYMKKPVNDMSHQNMVEEAANRIIEEKIGARVKFEFVDNDEWDSVQERLLSSGTGYDIIFDMGTAFIRNAQKDMYLDIKYLVDQYAPDIKEKTDEFAWQAVTFDDGMYAIPSQTFYVPYSCFAFKADLVEKYHFDYINVTTYSDLEPFFESIVQNESAIYPLCVTADTGIPEIQSHEFVKTHINVIRFDVKKDQYVSILESEPDRERYRITYEFNQKGYIALDASTKEDITTEIKSGRYAVFPGRMSANKTTNLYGFDCVESMPTYGVVNRYNVVNSVAAVNKNSKYPEKAIELLNLIWKDQELLNLLAYGIEGVDYTVVSEGEDAEKSVKTKSGNDVKWSIWHNWLGPLWDQWDSSWNTTESLEEMRKLNDLAEISPIIGFEPDLSNLELEITKLMNIGTECMPYLNTGSMPDFEEYMNALSKRFREAGMDIVLDEMNYQYKAWKEKQ